MRATVARSEQQGANVGKKSARLPWIFVDGSTQESFRIRLDVPNWDPVQEDTEPDEAYCSFYITADDGNAFAFQLQISGDVLGENRVREFAALLSLIQGKGVEIIEGAIHSGIRGDQRLVWETDGVSVVG